MTGLKTDVGNPILNTMSKTEYTTFSAKNKPRPNIYHIKPWQ